MHRFIAAFVRNTGTQASYIWDHGDVPNASARHSSDTCGAQQLLFTRLCSHYRTWMRVHNLDADAKVVSVSLLALAARCHSAT